MPDQVTGAKGLKNRGNLILLPLGKAKRLAVAAIEGDRAFINETRAERNFQKKKRRAERGRDLADATERAAAELGHKTYGVLLVDPPWRYNNPRMGDLPLLARSGHF